MAMLSRRTLVQGAAALSLTTSPLLASRLLAAADRPALPIPPEIRADANGVIALTARRGQMNFVPGLTTPTYGINGDYLGPTVRARRGDKLAMQVNNRLDQDITMHWHGAIVAGEADGGPHSAIKPAGTWTAAFTVAQPAATLWYHPHIYPATAELVVRGLAGLFIIDDEDSDALGLPSRYGVDDIPLVLQDRRFTPDGQIFHRMNLPAVTVGYVGDVMLVNGAPSPVAKTARGWLRFRVLNGSNARNYRFAVSDDRAFYMIATDGGLLEAPVEIKTIDIHPGERFEILIDARDGKPFDLVTHPVEAPIMRLPPFDGALPMVSIVPDGVDGAGRLPDALVRLPALPNELPPLSRTIETTMNLDAQGMGELKRAGIMKIGLHQPADPALVRQLTQRLVDDPALSESEQLAANGINGVPFALQMERMEVPRGRPLRWLISEGTDQMLHPIHIHGCQFRILSFGKGPVPPRLTGWKDTVPIEAGGSAEILVTFPLGAPEAFPYMVHCHILEHEDSGMMAQFTVS